MSYEVLLPRLETAVQRLTDLNPDGSRERNDVGWNSSDAAIGASLAHQVGRWTPGQAAIAHEIVSKYRRTQLADLDIPACEDKGLTLAAARDHQTKVDAAKVASSDPDFGIRFSAPRIVSTKNGERELREGAPTDAFWAAWRSKKEALKAEGWSVTCYNGNWSVKIWGLPKNRPVITAKKYEVKPLTKPEGLYPYQVNATARLVASLRAFNAVLDASDTGTGKTYTSLAALREVGLTSKILVVCPKSVIPSWHKAAAHLGVTVEAVNYEKLRTGKGRFATYNSATERFTYNSDLVQTVIFDEVHRAKGTKTVNSLLVISAKQQGLTVMALSATAADNPMDMKALGYVLNLHQLRGFWGWTRNYGCKPGTFGGFEFVGGPRELLKLHAQIFPERGQRVRIADLGDAFPETSIHTDLVAVEDAEAIDAAYAEAEKAMDSIAQAELNDNGAHHLTLLLRARQRAEASKIPAFVELTEDAIVEGNSVAIFVNFSESIRAIAAALRKAGYEVEEIHGNQTAEERQAAIERFQSDASRIIVANIRAGGVGVSLHDLNGNHPRLALISPTWSAVDLRQTLGRVHRAGGKTKSIQRILYAANTVEERVATLLERKLARLDALNDGDLSFAA